MMQTHSTQSIPHARGVRTRENAPDTTQKQKEDELTCLDKRLEAIERECRQVQGIGRTRVLGRDRVYNRLWWIYGLAAGGLVGHMKYCTRRVFVAGSE